MGQGLVFDLAITKGPGQATRFAAEVVRQGRSPVIAAGGDGTISEIVNGMVSHRESGVRPGPIGIVPLGSSNDLCKTLGIPLDPEGCARAIVQSRSASIDLCRINNRYFVLNGAVGIEAEISLIQSGIRWISGPVWYQLAALKGLLSAQQWNVRIRWESESYCGPLILVTVGNAPRTGGFYLSPHADIRDGLPTCVYVLSRNRVDFIRTMRRALRKPGERNYVELPGVFEIHAPWLHVEMTPATSSHADGEIMTEAGHRFHYTIVPGGIDILG